MAIYSEFSHEKMWFSIVMLVYQRVLSRIWILGFLWEVLWMVAKSGYHQLRAGKHPIIYRLLTIQGGAGFLPPTVSKCIKYPRLITTRTWWNTWEWHLHAHWRMKKWTWQYENDNFTWSENDMKKEKNMKNKTKKMKNYSNSLVRTQSVAVRFS